jgi:hypothetical protein
MNLERLKDLTGIAQNLLISLAVVVGGAWTIFMFWTERPDRKAEREAFAGRSSTSKSAPSRSTWTTRAVSMSLPSPSSETTET